MGVLVGTYAAATGSSLSQRSEHGRKVDASVARNREHPAQYGPKKRKFPKAGLRRHRRAYVFEVHVGDP